jgi:parallel beta-helix repeat protein
VIYNCGFSSRNSICAALQVSGETKVENCDFRNSSAGGLLCADTDSFDGVASVENCTFSNNGKAGLEVCKGGTLLAKNVNSYNNRQGLLIGPQAKKCVLTDSQINCNTYDGITVYECENDRTDRIELRNNFVFHNDHFGIGVRNSSALIAENRVFENGFWGIWLQSNSFCHISGNEVSHNRVGGIRIGKRPCGSPPSVLDDNKINDNCGPGLIQCINYLDVNTFVDKQPVFPVQWANPFRSSVPVLPPALEDTLVSAQCNGNTELRNGVKYTLTQPSMNKFCSFCRRKKVTIEKCTQCYVAEYCGQDCQEKHRKKHKKVCESILEKSSVLLTSTKKVRGPLRSWLQLGLVLVLVLWLLGWLGLWLGLGLELLLGSWLGFVCAKEHRYDLEGACPKHSKPPEYGKRFIVKVQQSYGFFDVDSMSLCICDQSLAIYDIFQSPHVNNLIRDLGAISERQFIGKKLFMWAAYTENRVGWKKLFMWVKGHEVRVFINEFPSYQQW